MVFDNRPQGSDRRVVKIFDADHRVWVANVDHSGCCNLSRIRLF